MIMLEVVFTTMLGQIQEKVEIPGLPRSVILIGMSRTVGSRTVGSPHSEQHGLPVNLMGSIKFLIPSSNGSGPLVYCDWV